MKITLNFKTPTVNHLYGQRRSGFGQTRFIKQEAIDLREEIKKEVFKSLPFICPNLNDGLRVTVEIHEDWLCKDGSVKRKDVANREKFLIDSIFDALNVDDKYIFEHVMRKVQDDKEFAVITIGGLND